jgi:hypothetical protein
MLSSLLGFNWRKQHAAHGRQAPSIPHRNAIQRAECASLDSSTAHLRLQSEFHHLVDRKPFDLKVKFNEMLELAMAAPPCRLQWFTRAAR